MCKPSRSPLVAHHWTENILEVWFIIPGLDLAFAICFRFPILTVLLQSTSWIYPWIAFIRAQTWPSFSVSRHLVFFQHVRFIAVFGAYRYLRCLVLNQNLEFRVRPRWLYENVCYQSCWYFHYNLSERSPTVVVWNVLSRIFFSIQFNSIQCFIVLKTLSYNLRAFIKMLIYFIINQNLVHIGNRYIYIKKREKQMIILDIDYSYLIHYCTLN